MNPSAMRWRRRFRGAATGKRELKLLFAKYVEMKQAQNVLDYDDLLLYWADLMEAARSRRRGRVALRSCAGR